MIGLVSSFVLGFTLIKGGMPWWIMIAAVVVLITADTFFGNGVKDAAHPNDLDH